MRNTISSFVIGTIVLLTATVATAADRNLTCTSSKGSIVIGICGVNGCKTTVTVGKTATTYTTKRTKDDTGALSYKTLASAKKACTIDIGALSKGSRKVTRVTCAKTLVGASCQIG